MIIHPDLRALRDDDTPQRIAQEALVARVSAWRDQPHVAALLAAVKHFAKGSELADQPELARLFDPDCEAAADLAHELAGATCAALAENWLGHAPFRHFTDDTISTLQLARSGYVTLSLVAIDGAGLAARPPATTADFSPSEVWERVLAGHARAVIVDRGATRPDRADLSASDVSLRPGSLIVRDARSRHMRLESVEGCLVSLRLQRRLPKAGPTREYALADGALVHQAAGTPLDSRTELMMALLGRMGRADAAPAMAAIACEPGSTALRWQALRECLSLDTATGFAALGEVARRADDELAPAAGALRSQLIETYPQLREIA
jgi:hypothetical protein